MTNRDRAHEIVGEIRTIDDERLIDLITAALDKAEKRGFEAGGDVDAFGVSLDPNRGAYETGKSGGQR